MWKLFEILKMKNYSFWASKFSIEFLNYFPILINEIFQLAERKQL
jgi:hypothetical protein